MSRELRLYKELKRADWSTNVTRLSLTVTAATGIQPELFVYKQLRFDFQTGGLSTTFAHVAYPDELTTYPITPTQGVNQFYLSDAVVKDYATESLAEAGCATILNDLQKLLNRLDSLDASGASSESFVVVVTDTTVTEQPATDEDTPTT